MRTIVPLRAPRRRSSASIPSRSSVRWNRSRDSSFLKFVRAAEVSIRRIQELVSERFQLSMDELCGDKRSQNIVYPRQVAMYLSRELTDSSLPKIGKEFGGRDHTTVIHATSKIARLIREDRSVYNLVQELTARVKQVR